MKNIDADVIELTKHIYVEDTLDGGASVWLRRPCTGDKEIPRFRERFGEIPWDWPQALGLAERAGKQEQDFIPIWCHCKGIKLFLHRGNYASKDREELLWFIDPQTNKPPVSFDVCDSCRLQFGTDIVHWKFADLANVTHTDGGVFPKTVAELKAAVDVGETMLGTLAYYQSSPNVQRYFCKVCSTSASCVCDDMPKVVKVAVGLLGASDGARAEGSLSWSFGDTPTGLSDTRGGWRERLIKSAQADAEKFRIARDYPKSCTRLKEAGSGLC